MAGGRRSLWRSAWAVSIAFAYLVSSAGGAGCAPGVDYGSAGEPPAGREPVYLKFTIETDRVHVAAARALAAEFETIGCRVSVKVLPWRDISRRARASENDASLLGWYVPTSDPLGLIPAKLSKAGVANFSGYSNAEVDRLLIASLRLPGETERQSCLVALQEMLYEESPWVFGVSEPLFDASSTSFTGWIPGPGGAVSLHDASLKETGGRATVGLGLEARPFLDPLEPAEPGSACIFRCLFDALAAVCPDGSLLPELAAGWEWSADARELTVRLRSGVTFHDGKPLLARDVVFTYTRALKGRLPAGLDVNASAADPATVIFAFSAPFPTFLELYGLQPIVPADYYESVGPEEFSRAPVGTGPFRYDPAAQDRHLLLARWDGYYGGPPELAPADPAQLDEVAFVFLPDSERRRAALEDGRISLAPALTPAEAVPFTSVAGAEVVAEPGYGLLALELDTRKPPFDDARVRLALNYALDRAALLASVAGPAGSRSLSPGPSIVPGVFLPDSAGFAPSAGVFQVDRGRSRSLLSEAGYLTAEP